MLSPHAGAQPAFTAAKLEAPEGHVLVDWGGSERTGNFELQVKRPGSDRFVSIYTGPDTASFRSGLEAGMHSYRVRSGPDGAWAAPLQVEVSYPARETALAWVGLGIVVFLATLAALFLGLKRRESP